MTVSVRAALAATPTGEPGLMLSWSEVGAYIAENHNRQEDKDREEEHQKREQLLNSGGFRYMDEFLDRVYADRAVAEQRKKWVRYTNFSSPIRIISKEISTTYSSPAKRFVAGDENQRRFDLVQEQLQLDTLMQSTNRRFNVHHVLVGLPRVRQRPDATRDVVVDVHSPATFRPVLHPNDSTMVVGYMFRTEFKSRRGVMPVKPAWVLWTDHERVHLDKNFKPIEDTVLEHGIGLAPCVVLKRHQNQPGFWPGNEGADLTAAEFSVWFSNILGKKEEKTATRMPVISGDADQITRGQVVDSGSPAHVPDGAAINTIEIGTDPDIFIGNAQHVMESVANAYGMSAAYVKHQGIQSAEARDMMRVPIRELRLEQEPMFRLFERRLAEVLSAVLAKDAPELAFSADGFRINFGEAQTPLTRREAFDLFEKERGAAIDNTIAFLRRRDPDLADEDAEDMIRKNLEVETWRVTEMRDLQAMGAGPAQETPPTRGGDSADEGDGSPAQLEAGGTNV